ncbi:MAG: hypothetical protein ACKO4Z_10860 [Planctomycetota bacterium]|nr:hypothetical protein [Planctomycetota bacterium]
MTALAIRRTLLAAAVATALTCPAPAADGSVVLRYRFVQDESIPMQVRHRALTETTMNGVTQAVETMTDSTRSWRVVAVEADGTATLEHTVDDVTMTSRTSDQGELRWSSGSGEDPPPGYELVPHSLGKPLVRMTVASDGRILQRLELRPCPPAATGDLVVVPLPQEAVAIGAEWTVPQEVVVEVPNGPRKAVRTRLRYRLDSVADGIATIAVDTTVLTPVDDPRLEARLMERIWDGTIRFDVNRGRVVGRRTAIDRRVVGFGGPQSSVRYKASLEEESLAEAEAIDQSNALDEAKPLDDPTAAVEAGAR